MFCATFVLRSLRTISVPIFPINFYDDAYIWKVKIHCVPINNLPFFVFNSKVNEGTSNGDFALCRRNMIVPPRR